MGERDLRRTAGALALRALVAAAALVVALALGLRVEIAQGGEPAAPVTGQDGLRPGAFVWTPQFAPAGPVMIVVGLREQRAYVYRNGVRIGIASVSTGKVGYETPTGIFSILQKRREHYSNLYDNAPMPFMQRLTWDGIALHAGNVTGYPASHGCVRLPYEFSEKLFGITAHGMTVIVTESIPSVPIPAIRGLFSPTDDLPGRMDQLPAPAATAVRWSWRPERSPTGPLNVLLSTADQEILILRNGVEIGWAAIEFRDARVSGTFVYTLLDGPMATAGRGVAERAALNWLAIPIAASHSKGALALRDAFALRSIVLPEAFSAHVYESLAPGATMVITDEPIRSEALVLPATLLESNNAAGAN